MEQAKEGAGKPVGGRRTMTTVAKLGVLAALIVTALAIRLMHHRAEHVNPLDGDMETATGGVADMLRKTPTERQTSLLLEYLNRPNSGVRYAAVDALGREHGPQVIEAVENAFTDSASVVRQRAMEVLPGLDSEKGLRLLLAGLQDEDQWIREAAAQQLNLYDKLHLKNIQRALPTLVASLSDPDTVISKTDMMTLRKITGQPWHATLKSSSAERAAAIAHWQTWWRANESRYAIPAEFDHIQPIRPTRSDPAPDYDLGDIDGHPLNPAAQRGKVTLLNFWGTWCPPCQQEIPDLVRLNETYRGRPVDIVGIALSETDGAEGLRKWCRAHGVAYRQALSTDAIQNAFGHIEEVPVSVLIDAQGQVRYRWEGERDYDTFRKAIDRLLSPGTATHAPVTL
jgi:thiol-disulfide isomerase/thioredoxin